MKSFIPALSLVLIFACTKTESSNEKYSLIQYSGTIAGITKSFPQGQCLWTISDNDISIQINESDPYIHNLKTAYSKTVQQNTETWMIDSLGAFSVVRHLDTLFLNPPCCDFINYILVEE